MNDSSSSVVDVSSVKSDLPVDQPSLVTSFEARLESYRGLDEPFISSMIHDAARITNWRAVLALCKTHPEAAKFAGRDGLTSLHHACGRRCPYADVVEALVKAYPDALLEEDEKGWTPLHYACRFKAPEDVVRSLLYLYPERGQATVSHTDRKGRTPLFYAVRYDAPFEVVRLLLELDPSAVLEEDRNADDDDGKPEPKFVSMTSRLSPSSSTASEQKSVKEEEDASRLDIVSQLLRADPTVLPSC